ncbi:MAG: hypothetical protein JNK30_16775 [Phenylobacterium sp.]|uniref:hypothetical protein n=1 Tax=Phenylobacterium sp. TaxID=1871053 RepID=UPI001A6170F6|nr:hypothetical protein [Phenylobacterium sp.]MBL8773039.1 hypothetical protein [Phenylobacterium sp.]
MAEYKIYVLGPSGMIARGIWFDRPDDEAAAEFTQTRAPDEARELWCGDRLVGTFERAAGAG